MFSASELIAVLLRPVLFILSGGMHKSSLTTFVLKFWGHEFGMRQTFRLHKVLLVCRLGVSENQAVNL